ncbi:MAG: B12-binding domain-containing radical SAM protein [Calditrichaceae bacterium]|nr:B12-binding domain-containing radical SAM protein [Calditrichaceae bacterium]MBN2708732.1 B12-binding domain-containing radical SAM protein [Calditrichaceae bacterium]RQV97099.1 MAG: radical SAM protein [Calditrichota bacterium]
MFKIALINPLKNKKLNYIPTGICYLSSYLKKNIDHPIQVRIFNIDINSLYRVIDFGPDLIGFTSFTHNFNLVCRMAEIIKEALPDRKIIIGGQHITMAPWSMPGIYNYGIIGEGERTLSEIVKRLLTKNEDEIKTLPGIQYWDQNQIIQTGRCQLIEPLDDIPFPDRDAIDELKDIIDADHFSWFLKSNLKSLQLTTSRGCPYKCRFCQPSVMWQKLRQHSPEYIAEEIEHIYKKYHINALLVEDDLFATSKKRLSAINDLLSRKNLTGKIIYYITARTHLIDKDYVELFKELGVVKVEFGIESGSQEVARYLKNFNVHTEGDKQAISLLNSAGISVFASFIAGSPVEKIEDLKQTEKMISWIYKSSSKNSCGISLATPLPGTELWNYAETNGLAKRTNINWDHFSALESIPKDISTIIYLNSHIALPKLLKTIKRIRRKIWLGTPTDFIKALPRRTRKAGERIRRKFKIAG